MKEELTVKQKSLLKELSTLFDKICDEAQESDSFNNILFNLGIFAKSIDEAAAEINEVIE